MTKKWIDAGPRAEYPPGTKQCVEVDGVRVVVCNVDDQLVAVANICPHAHLPLGEGELHGRILVCPFHGYSYDVTTGKNADYPLEELPVPTYPVRINDENHVEVEVPEEQ